MNSNEKVSVIMPVYNVEKYIMKSVESVINQTYRNIEIFLIDDGSKDKSGKICDEFAQIDDRITVIHKENGGQGSARNVALNLCNGQYICFLDSDDYIDKDYIEFLLKLLKKEKADIACCNYRIMSEDGNFIKNRHWGFGLRRFSNINAITSIWYNDAINIGPWAKIYKSDLWKDTRFKECYAEDFATIHKIFLKTKKIVYSYKCKHNYLKSNNSSLRSSFNEQKLIILKIAKDNIEFSKFNKKLYKAAYTKAISAYFHILFQLPVEGYNKQKQDIHNFISKYRIRVLFNYKSGIKIKCAIILSFFGFDLANKVFNRCYKK